MRSKLENRVCLVTGAGSGIGKRILEHLASQGGQVISADLNEAAAHQSAHDIRQRGGRAKAFALDVSCESQVGDVVAAVVAEFGRVDVLVSNAGIQVIHPLPSFPFADWKLVLDVHLGGAFLTTKACWPHMQKAGGGSIIYLGSVHSREASVLKSAYVAAKHGLLGLARAAAKEGGPHRIRVNVVCPGFVDTALVRDQIPQQAQALGISESEVIKDIMLKHTVNGEFVSLDDVAMVVAFLAGFPSSALTGQSVFVTNGWSAQ